MKKVKSTLILLVIIALAVFVLTACGNKSKCEHDYSYITIKEPTCTEKGVASGVCSLCGDDITKHIDPLGHDEVSHEAKAATCTENGYDAYVDCSRCDYTTFRSIATIDHIWENGTCLHCEASDLAMQLSYDGSYYIVTGIGNFKGSELIISSTYKNKPVTEIKSYAFMACTNLTSAVIPDTIMSIGDCAFYECWNLTSVIIPDSVTSIGSAAFDWCGSITIYCEATSKPSGWDSDWNCLNCPVVWGYTGE